MDTRSTDKKSEGKLNTFKPFPLNSILKILLLTAITVLLFMKSGNEMKDIMNILVDILGNKTLETACKNALHNSQSSPNFI